MMHSELGGGQWPDRAFDYYFNNLNIYNNNLSFVTSNM